MHLRPRLVWWQIVIVLANSFTPRLRSAAQANINTARIGSADTLPLSLSHLALFDLILLFLIIFLLHYVPPTRLYLASRNFSFFAGDHTRPPRVTTAAATARGGKTSNTTSTSTCPYLCVCIYDIFLFYFFGTLPHDAVLFRFETRPSPILAQCLCPYIIFWPPWSPIVFRTPLEPQRRTF